MDQMTRADLTRGLAATTVLRDAQLWSSGAHDLLGQLLQELKCSKPESALGRALHAQLMRMKRYFLALQRLSFPVGPGWIHAVDGAHAIHKSLFETYVEHALCLTYAELFKDTLDEAGDDLATRLFVYSDFVQRKKNFQRLHRIDKMKALMDRLGAQWPPTPGMAAFADKGIEGVRQDLVDQAERIGGPGARFAQLGHWFPERNSNGDFFTRTGEPTSQRPRNTGSMEWRCKAVLAQHFPDKNMLEWWEASYDQYYDMLNVFTHPALGYDENFRGEPERLADLCRMQVGIQIGLHLCVLPSVRAVFRQAWANLIPRDQELETQFRQVVSQAIPWLGAIDRTDYRNLPR
jgi:hypothetical protein